MDTHLDIGDAKYARAAGEILRRHGIGEAEANITSAIRDFLTLTGLARREEMVEENPPSDGSRRAVDLTALDTFVEVKRRIGTAQGFEPNPEYVQQLDDYLAESERGGGRVRMGILTDGRRWLLRWPGAGDPRTVYPYAFTLESEDGWLSLYEWLRDRALESRGDIPVERATVAESFGPGSARYNRDITRLRELYDRYSDMETIKIKRRLWSDLLRAALGEAASTAEDADDLFVRHTYLTTVIGIVVQASFGLDIRRLAERDAEDLLKGRELYNATGLQGVVESDFFAWPSEVGGLPLVRAIARRAARFDWPGAPADIAAILYESVIPPEERRQLGEYYTPAWLARAMVEEVVTEPLEQRVLDPSCGSGTFIVEAVRRVIEAARESGLRPEEVFGKLRDSVIGIDVHPVAVHLARAAWSLAARTAIESAADTSISVPIYLGDALQLRFRTGDMFAQHEVTIEVGDERNSALVFPVSLVERANDFDSLINDVSAAIESGGDPKVALGDNGISDAVERETLTQSIETMRRLHSEGSDHIWGYYIRNLVRPVALSRSKVDVIIGNPPWLNYNQTASALRTELRNQSENLYDIWVGGRYATHQDVAGLFFARSVDLYLKDGGIIGMVMPHSALQTGQYRKWRTGRWNSGPPMRRTLSVDFGVKSAWDLERLEPNTFFPVPSCVAFARRTGEAGGAVALSGGVERWIGEAGSSNVRRERAGITDTSEAGESPYGGYSRQGASIVPRCLFFVNETENRAVIQAGQTITVNPRRGSQDKAPWKNLELSEISEQTIETSHVYDVHLGETVVPYATLPPLKVVLPVRRGDDGIPTDADGVSGIRLGGLDRRMRGRWQTVSDLWEENKARANRLNLLGQLDYIRKLSSQLEWMKDPGDRPVRVVYTQSGTPTATIIHDDSPVVDYKLYWIACKDKREANYLLAIINSDTLYEATKPFMPRGQYGARDLMKHLWKLPIPEFDAGNDLHVSISDAGWRAAEGAAARLSELYEERDRVTVTIARRELRAWLRGSDAGREVESLVGGLLV